MTTESEEQTQSGETISKRIPVPDERLCTANVHGTDRRCKVAAIKGGTVCVYHGGSAPQVRAAANRRLLEMADLALKTQAVLMLKAETPDAVKASIARDVLDRIGMAPTLKIESDVHVFDTREILLAEVQEILERNGTSPVPTTE